MCASARRSRDALRDALAARGVAVELVAADTFVALDTTTETVGLTAAGAGIVIYEMAAEHVDLEDVPRPHRHRGGDPMTHLVRAELLKLRTTRMFWAYVAAAVAFVPLSVALAITVGQRAARTAPTGPASRRRGVVRRARAARAGILVMAGEFRHGTATSTFLITPDRRRVVAAKVLAASTVGLVLAIVTSAVTLAVAIPWLQADGVDVTSYGSDIALGLLGSIAATTLAPLVGVGFGAIVTSQTVAITIALIWSQVVEGLLVGFLPEVGRWLPGGAASALAGVETPSGGMLPMWAAAVVLAAYGLAFAAAGAATLARRDVA